MIEQNSGLLERSRATVDTARASQLPPTRNNRVGRILYKVLREGIDAQMRHHQRTTSKSLSAISGIVRESARPFRPDDPSSPARVAPLLESLADRLEHVATSMDQLELEDIVTGVQSFARRRPELFVAIAFGVGCLGAYLLISHAEDETVAS